MISQRVVMGLALVFAVGACATKPVSNEAARLAPPDQIIDRSYMEAGPDKVKVIVKRDSGFQGSACSSRVFVNGVPIADIWPSEKIVLFLSRGEYILSTRPNGICGAGLSEVRADLRSGTPATFRIGSSSSGTSAIYQTAF